jgi:hypothetical protein
MKKIASSPDIASALSSGHVPARPSSRPDSSQSWKSVLARTELTGPQRLLMQAAFGQDADAAWQRWCSTTDFDDLSLAAQRLMPRIHERPDVDSASDARIHGLYRRSRYLNRMLLQALAELAGNLTDRGIACVAVGPVPAVLGGAPYPLDCLHLAVADTSAADAPSAHGWIPERSGFERELLVRSLGFTQAELRLRLHCRPAGDNDFWRDVAPIGWEGATITVPAPARQLIDAVAPADGWWKTPYPERAHYAVLAIAAAPAGTDWSPLTAAARDPEVAALLAPALELAEWLELPQAPACRTAVGTPPAGTRTSATGRVAQLAREYRRVRRRYRLAGVNLNPAEFARLHWRERRVSSVLARQIRGA